MITVRTEVTDRMLIFGTPPVHVLAAYAEHYNGWRPHPALHLAPPRSQHPPIDADHRRVTRRPILGGLINEYDRAA